MASLDLVGYRMKRMLIGMLAVLAGSAGARGDGDRPRIHFSRDIKPILSNVCYTCHGPDEKAREAGLRLDSREGATATLESGGAAIVPGDLEASQLYRRITATDPDQRMPPATAEKQLSPEQIDLLKRWIEEGADWRGHWSLVKPERPEVPEVKAWPWPRNEVDYFILARLEREGMTPNPLADKETLVRRVTLDLTGLPPTIAEVDQFLADPAPDAYEKLVDRLLASPRYGEHMARYWLDAARYGDTHGLHLDNEREIWPYRDWVIGAFNRNLPFDRFTIEQLAGDLLPEPTLEQRIATGFNRCNVTTSEGGSIDEEYYVRYAVDRVETTATVWMGLTLGCAVCHDHKYDPFTQKEFYQLFAFFNSLTEKPMDGNAKDPPPVIRVPNAEQTAQLAQIAERIKLAEARLEAPMPETDAAQAAWEREWHGRLAELWRPLELVEYQSTGGASLRKLEDGSILAEGTNPDKDVYEVTARTELERITALRLEALTHESLVGNGPGRSENANFVLSEFEAEAVSIADPARTQKISFALAQADYSQADGGYLIEKAIDGIVDGTNGWAVDGNTKHENRTAVFVPSAPIGFPGGTLIKLKLRHESQFAKHAIGRFRFAATVEGSMAPTRFENWYVAGPFRAESGDAAHQTAFGPELNPGPPFDPAQTFEETRLKWVERSDLAEGKPNRLRGKKAATYLSRVIDAPSPRKLMLHLASDDSLKVWLNGAVILDRPGQRGLVADSDTVSLTLAAGPNRLLVKVVNHDGPYAFQFRKGKEEAGEEWVKFSRLLALEPERRTAEEAKALRDYFRALYSPEWKAARDELAQLREEEKRVSSQVPTTMVMQELPERREAFVLVRGEYEKKGEKVTAAVPASLPPLPPSPPVPDGKKPDRLALARWLVDPAHPLTARVTVNRYWQQYFGTGIVKTAEDFGSQGEWPMHPELLDWLATEFVQTGWDVKRMQRLLVTSATYRQSAKAAPEAFRRDPDNRLLARGPRFRMDAEMVRDNALALSGLLVEKMGTKGVKPYQPPGLWEAVAYTDSNTAKFARDSGEALYRRSLYTFWKRTAPPPVMLAFDAPSREACTVRRGRTNTPLQALALMNDEQFVEAARHLAQRIMIEGGATVESRIEFVYRHVLARRPTDDERRILREQFEGHRARFQADPAAASQLISVGESKPNGALEPVELAAWTMIANLLLNLDETVTKG